MTSSSRRIEWNKKLQILVFGPHYCSKASHGQCCTIGLKTTLKLLVHVLAIIANSYLKIVFSQKSGVNLPLKQNSKIAIFGNHYLFYNGHWKRKKKKRAASGRWHQWTLENKSGLRALASALIYIYIYILFMLLPLE